MIVLNHGIPRSGTVLINAIVRALLQRAGIPSVAANPHGSEVCALLKTLQSGNADQHVATVIHTHSWDSSIAKLVSETRHLVGFVNHRDPRDVVVSLMKLHEHDIGSAVNMTMEAFRVFEMVCRDTEFMVIPYEGLISSRTRYILQIAQRLGLQPSLNEVAGVDEETSVARHRHIMDQVRSGKRERVLLRQNRNRVLVEDRDTLINDRHIQSGKAGRWREELDDKQKDALTRLFAPFIERYGYSAKDAP